MYLFRYNDPPYLKVKKVELLTEVCAASNAKDIINELGWALSHTHTDTEHSLLSMPTKA